MKKVSIGSVTVDPPLILAPLAGISNLPFRVVCRLGGAGMVWTEMISARALSYGDRRTREMGIFHPDEHPVAAQIFGRDPMEMADAARYLKEQGADLIDINMGCPVKKILKSGSGVWLMREPTLAVAIVREVVRAVNLPVTVKLRLGWSDQEMNYLELGRSFEDHGAAALVLHPRTRVQGFTGQALWSHIGKLAQEVSIPVIGSGDIAVGEDAAAKLEETGCAALMIGRAALGKPWIFRAIYAYIIGSKFAVQSNFSPELMQKHLELMIEYLPGRRSVGHLRKHLAWYSKGFSQSSAFRREINGLAEPEEIIEKAEEFFNLDMESGRWKVE